MSEKAVGMVGLFIAILAIFVSLLVPEIREYILGLDKTEEKVNNQTSPEEPPAYANPVHIPKRSKCLTFDNVNSDTIYLSVKINGKTVSVYNSDLERFIGAKKGKKVTLIDLKLKSNKEEGILLSFIMNTTSKKTSEFQSVDDINTEGLITMVSSGNLTFKDLVSDRVILECAFEVSDVQTAIDGNNGIRSLILKSLQSI